MLGFVVTSDFLLAEDKLAEVQSTSPVIPVSLILRLGDRQYLDRGILGHDSPDSLTAEEFYGYMSSHPDMKDFPGTSQPNPQMFLAAYEKASGLGVDHIIALSVLPKHSGSFNSAVQAAQQLTGQVVDYPDFGHGNYQGLRPYFSFDWGPKRIDIINTGTASAGLGHLVYRLWKTGGDLSRIQELRSQIYIGVAIADARYLAQRITDIPLQMRSMLGAGLNRLQLKALFEIIDGEIKPTGGISRTERGIYQKIMAQLLSQDFDREIYALNTGPSSSLDGFVEQLTGLPGDNRFFYSSVTPPIGSYIGPGRYGIVSYPR